MQENTDKQYKKKKKEKPMQNMNEKFTRDIDIMKKNPTKILELKTSTNEINFK